MSIDLFDEPYRISFSVPEAVRGSRVGMLLGVNIEGTTLGGVCMLEDGSITLANAAHFTIDFRYDPETDRFLDHGVQKGDQEG